MDQRENSVTCMTFERRGWNIFGECVSLAEADSQQLWFHSVYDIANLSALFCECRSPDYVCLATSFLVGATIPPVICLDSENSQIPLFLRSPCLWVYPEKGLPKMRRGR